MNKTKLLLVNLLAVALAGCGSSGSSDTAASTGTGGDTTGNTTGETAGETTGTTAGTAGTQGNNPGRVPETVLAELTTLDITGADAPRGHKIFAGNETRTAFAGLENLVENSYFNLDFPCSGEGVFEFWPSPQFATFWTPGSGNFTWGTVDAADTDDSWDLDATGILGGDPDNGILVNGISVRTIVNGALIVGTAVAEDLVVTRIVQYEECS